MLRVGGLTAASLAHNETGALAARLGLGVGGGLDGGALLRRLSTTTSLLEVRVRVRVRVRVWVRVRVRLGLGLGLLGLGLG